MEGSTWAVEDSDELSPVDERCISVFLLPSIRLTIRISKSQFDFA